ncbi:MAG: hypothetical protein ACI9XO_002894 [Paraglaciecola sp.]|jgi:hypothetical protein
MKFSQHFPSYFLLLFGLIFFSFNPVSEEVNSFDPAAGFITSLAQNSIILAAANVKDLPKITDGDPSTFWQSDAPLPQGFINRKELNCFYKKGLDFFLYEGGEKIFDGNLNNATLFRKRGEKARMKIKFPDPKYLYSISTKMQIKEEVEIFVKLKNGLKKRLDIYGYAENYKLERFDIQEVVEEIEFVSNEGFSVFEIAALAELPKEALVFDFFEKKQLGKLILKNWSGGQAIKSTTISVSNDKKNWEEVRTFRGEFAFPYAVNFPVEKEAQYLKLECEVTGKDWQKVSIFEVKVYDENGEFGAKPIAQKSPANLKEMLGVNGYWSWGNNTFSTMLKPGEGPALYQSISSHGRNYHDLTWDLKTPDQSIDFTKMKTAGTPVKEWLNWDREYKAWADAGMDIQASIQFYRFRDKQWKTAYKSAYNYGQSFAKYFGGAQGNGLICAIEVGNEPWQYAAATYREILYGMAKGVKMADPNLEVFPCALQAVDPDAETNGGFRNYIGARIPKAAMPYLDGINIHAYSYILNKFGQRKSTYPEHQNSTFWEVLNAIKWRDKNMPGKKIYLSEWGYDGEGGGEDCTHSECISEGAAANYSLRNLLIAARLGMHRATWYFYANSDEKSSLYTRSGLTSSKKNGFQKKEVFQVLENLIEKYGELHFLEVLQENSEGWVYAFTTMDESKEFIIAWRPTDYKQRKLKSEYILKSGRKVKKAEFLQQPDFNFSEKGLAKFTNGQIRLQFCAIPVIFELEK